MEDKSNTASGMPVCLWRNGIGSRSSGKERDAETGLDYFLARYYSGAQGRFLSPDEYNGGPDDALTGRDITPPGPLPYADISNPQSLNKYAYVYNNPLRFTDPDGHFVLVDDIFYVAAAVAATAALVSYLVSPPGKQAIRNAVDPTIVLTKAAGDAISGLLSKSETKPESKASDGSTTQAKPKSSEQIRKEWEKTTDQPWPKDATTGRNQDVSHKKAKADGGTDELSNIEPKPHKEHIDQHKEKGDFKRWGERRKVPGIIPPEELPK